MRACMGACVFFSACAHARARMCLGGCVRECKCVRGCAILYLIVLSCLFVLLFVSVLLLLFVLISVRVCLLACSFPLCVTAPILSLPTTNIVHCGSAPCKDEGMWIDICYGVTCKCLSYSCR